jgi:hypothetical protein
MFQAGRETPESKLTVRRGTNLSSRTVLEDENIAHCEGMSSRAGNIFAGTRLRQHEGKLTDLVKPFVGWLQSDQLQSETILSKHGANSVPNWLTPPGGRQPESLSF